MLGEDNALTLEGQGYSMIAKHRLHATREAYHKVHRCSICDKNDAYRSQFDKRRRAQRASHVSVSRVSVASKTCSARAS